MKFICAGILLLLGLLTVSSLAASDEGESLPKEEIEAAFLLNFAQYVEWPVEDEVSASAPLILTVVGEDPFGQALDRCARGRKVNGRPFEVHRVAKLEDVTDCEILYLGAPEAQRVGRLPVGLRGKPILTVGEEASFCRRGGMISFVDRGESVGFQINPEAAAAVHLKISSKLLKLASIVRPE